LNKPERKVRELLEGYYRERGWYLKTGIPVREKLREPGLA